MTNQDQKPENPATRPVTEPITEAEETLPQKKTFGIELRVARESANLTVADVAEKLLVSADIIHSIENSEVENLPALTFTKGYIRSYARLLEIPADKIISEYLKVAPDQKPALSSLSVLPMQTSSSHLFIKIISAAFAVFAVIILLYWLYQTDFSLQTSSYSQRDAARQPLIEKAESIKPVPATSPAVTPEAETAEHQPLTVAVKPTHQPVIKPQSQQGLLAETESHAVSETKNNIQSVVEEESVSAPVPRDVMVLAALESSWIEAKDQTGQRLFYQLLNAGEDIKLYGKSPFTVFLGNARKVRIEINQKIVSFDHLINNSKKTVRIKVEADAGVSPEPR
ncbi:hypothetical protein MNBD_GAMMA09-2199 [hydrothermal vent metagenome]|uniref:HTH cro/C1-type domain-containing protein n=1 Tax=hydrothermal vent metagenome TaxID=652676 RepID=A0A3B0YPZ5_9ZZZZ